LSTSLARARASSLPGLGGAAAVALRAGCGELWLPRGVPESARPGFFPSPAPGVFSGACGVASRCVVLSPCRSSGLFPRSPSLDSPGLCPLFCSLF